MEVASRRLLLVSCYARHLVKPGTVRQGPLGGLLVSRCRFLPEVSAKARGVVRVPAVAFHSRLKGSKNWEGGGGAKSSAGCTDCSAEKNNPRFRLVVLLGH